MVAEIQDGWSEAEVETLRRMRRESKSFSMIAAAIGRGLTRNAVAGKAWRIGLCAKGVKPTRTKRWLQPKVRGISLAPVGLRKPEEK